MRETGHRQSLVSRRKRHGFAKCFEFAGELGPRAKSRRNGAHCAADTAGNYHHLDAGNFHWRKPRRPPSGGCAGNGSVRSCRRFDGISRAIGRCVKTPGTISGEFDAVATEENLLLFGCARFQAIRWKRFRVLGARGFAFAEKTILVACTPRRGAAPDAISGRDPSLVQLERRRDTKSDERSDQALVERAGNVDFRQGHDSG